MYHNAYILLKIIRYIMPPIEPVTLEVPVQLEMGPEAPPEYDDLAESYYQLPSVPAPDYTGNIDPPPPYSHERNIPEHIVQIISTQDEPPEYSTRCIHLLKKMKIYAGSSLCALGALIGIAGSVMWETCNNSIKPGCSQDILDSGKTMTATGIGAIAFGALIIYRV